MNDKKKYKTVLSFAVLFLAVHSRLWAAQIAPLESQKTTASSSHQ